MSPIPHYNQPPQPEPERPVPPVSYSAPVPGVVKKDRGPWPWLALAVVVIVVVGVVYSLVFHRSALERNDLKGYQACEQLVKARDGGESSKARLGALLDAGRLARAATTPGIRRSAHPLSGLSEFALADVKKLEVACEDAGVNIPNAR